ncbi:unnamed protein product [Pieris macdunnoughi]|uniref:Peptidase S1 domain-containing protein n=1 Tax=Pieris macdunnoughi TaxID=345717 RepID=A0A821R4N3_9NEOP|nr:unnamed protein product [Pieris macdunnoughi]
MYSFLSICIFALLFQVQGSWARDARPGEFPYQADVVQTLRNGEYLYLCAGAILNQRFIITVAFLVELYPQSSLRVLAGSNDLNSPSNIYYKVDSIRSYYQNSYNFTIISRNNIALVRIKTRFTFNAKIQPITISKQDIVDGETLTISARRNPYDPNYVSRLQVLLGNGVQDNDDCGALAKRDVDDVKELFCLRQNRKDIGNDNLPPFSYQGGPIVGANKQLKGILLVSLNSIPDGKVVGIGLRAYLYRQFIYETIN